MSDEAVKEMPRPEVGRVDEGEEVETEVTLPDGKRQIVSVGAVGRVPRDAANSDVVMPRRAVMRSSHLMIMRRLPCSVAYSSHLCNLLRLVDTSTQEGTIRARPFRKEIIARRLPAASSAAGTTSTTLRTLHIQEAVRRASACQ